MHLNLLFLTYLEQLLPLSKNHSIDLLCKLTDWFLYDGNFDLKSVNFI